MPMIIQIIFFRICLPIPHCLHLAKMLKEILIKNSLEEESHYIMTKVKLYILHIGTET